MLWFGSPKWLNGEVSGIWDRVLNFMCFLVFLPLVQNSWAPYWVTNIDDRIKLQTRFGSFWAFRQKWCTAIAAVQGWSPAFLSGYFEIQKFCSLFFYFHHNIWVFECLSIFRFHNNSFLFFYCHHSTDGWVKLLCFANFSRDLSKFWTPRIQYPKFFRILLLSLHRKLHLQGQQVRHGMWVCSDVWK